MTEKDRLLYELHKLIDRSNLGDDVADWDDEDWETWALKFMISNWDAVEELFGKDEENDIHEEVERRR